MNISLERWLPDGPKRTIEVTDYFFGPDASPEQIEELLAFDTQVGEEDTSLVESVQRGLTSAAYDRGRYAPEVETAELHFHQLLAAALRAQSTASPAASLASGGGLTSLRSKT